MSERLAITATALTLMLAGYLVGRAIPYAKAREFGRINECRGPREGSETQG